MKILPFIVILFAIIVILTRMSVLLSNLTGY